MKLTYFFLKKKGIDLKHICHDYYYYFCYLL